MAQFRAYCTVKRIGRALSQTFKLTADPTKEPMDDKLKPEFRKQVQDNRKSVAELTLAFTTRQLMEYVVQSETPQYPEGVAKDIVQKPFLGSIALRILSQV